MKARLKTAAIEFELDANSPKDMFRLIAETQEVFGEHACGLCTGKNLRFRIRTVEGNDYHELVCLSCGAKLHFGQSKAKPGHLFPVRKLTTGGKPSRKDGSYGDHQGWHKFAKVRDDGQDGGDGEEDAQGKGW